MNNAYGILPFFRVDFSLFVVSTIVSNDKVQKASIY